MGFFQCAHCFKKFSTKYNLKRHIKKLHRKISLVYPCDYCASFKKKRVFKTMSGLKRHKYTHKKGHEFDLLNSAFNKDCAVYRKHYNKTLSTWHHAFGLLRNSLAKLLQVKKYNSLY